MADRFKPVAPGTVRRGPIPEQWERMQNGLIYPVRQIYPRLADSIGDGEHVYQPAGYNAAIQLVHILRDDSKYQSTLGQIPSGSFSVGGIIDNSITADTTQTATGNLIPAIQPGGAIPTGNTLWTPASQSESVVTLNSAASGALNRYRATCPAGWGWRIEEIVSTFTPGSARITGVDAFYVAMSPGTALTPATNVNTLPFEKQAWYRGIRAGKLTASTAYYAVLRRGAIPLAAEFDDEFGVITNAARTAGFLGLLPEFIITVGGQIEIGYGADSGVNKDYTEVMLRVLISWFKLA